MISFFSHSYRQMLPSDTAPRSRWIIMASSSSGAMSTFRGGHHSSTNSMDSGNYVKLPPPPPPPAGIPPHHLRLGMAGGGGRPNGGMATAGRGVEVLKVSSQNGLGAMMSQVGVWCERCNSRLVELKKQAVRLMIMHPSLMRLAMKVSIIGREYNWWEKCVYIGWNWIIFDHIMKFY